MIPPRPPNRTCGFPAYGSPVGGFLIGSVSRSARPCEVRAARHRRRKRWASADGRHSSPRSQPLVLLAQNRAQPSAGEPILSIRLYHRPPLTPLSSADTMRSVQTEASTHDQLRGFCTFSSPCGHCRCSLCSVSVHSASTFLPTFPRRGFAIRAFRGSSPLQYYAGSDSCRASPARQVSPFHPLAFRASNPQPRCAPARHVLITSCVRSVPFSPRLRHTSRRLAATPRRIGFVILQAARSPPAAPHHVSRRRSCLRLHVW